jgi:hypothetical protein
VIKLLSLLFLGGVIIIFDNISIAQRYTMLKINSARIDIFCDRVDDGICTRHLQLVLAIAFLPKDNGDTGS